MIPNYNNKNKNNKYEIKKTESGDHTPTEHETDHLVIDKRKVLMSVSVINHYILVVLLWTCTTDPMIR